MTREELIEKVAAGIYNADYPYCREGYARQSARLRESYQAKATAAIDIVMGEIEGVLNKDFTDVEFDDDTSQYADGYNNACGDIAHALTAYMKSADDG